MELCEIYLTGILYKGVSWVENPDSLLDQVYNNLNEIKNFDFASISLNMAQVYNVSLKQSNYDSMVMFLKHARYKHNEFLTLSDVQNLVIEIKRQLAYIAEFSYVGIEMRLSKFYTDKDLGLVPPRRSI
jgi:hypothetical protein